MSHSDKDLLDRIKTREELEKRGFYRRLCQSCKGTGSSSDIRHPCFTCRGKGYSWEQWRA